MMNAEVYRIEVVKLKSEVMEKGIIDFTILMFDNDASPQQLIPYVKLYIFLEGYAYNLC